jgi:hypothetical protein
VMFVASQWMSCTRELLRGTSRSTIKSTHLPGPFSSDHHTGELMIGRWEVSVVVVSVWVLWGYWDEVT